MDTADPIREALTRLGGELDALGQQGLALGRAADEERKDSATLQGDLDALLAELERAGQRARHARDALGGAGDRVRAMGAAVDESGASFERLSKSLGRAADDGAEVAQLVDKVREVPRAASRIVELSQSANMLALNATIEAERAGAAQASGFRVVATEMKELAREIRSFAEGIVGMVEGLSTDFGEVARRLDRSLTDCASAKTSAQAAFERVPEAQGEAEALVGAAQTDAETTVAGLAEVLGRQERLRGILSAQGERAGQVERVGADLQSTLEKAMGAIVAVSDALGQAVPVDLTPSEARARWAEFDRVIDVRTAEEYRGELGHIEGSVLSTIDERFADSLEGEPRDRRLLFVCRSGGRSGRAAGIACEAGFRNVFNLAGGMLAWNEQSLPVVR